MSDSKTDYQLLAKQLEALLSGERNWLTNISQFVALVFNNLNQLNWAGFYLKVDDAYLKLGPFQGQVACTTIKIGKGVCGTSAEQRESVLVKDVDQFEGHIVCDSRSRSELVCPVIIDNQLWGVFDLDSPILSRFDKQDQLGFEELIRVLIRSTDWNAGIGHIN